MGDHRGPPATQRPIVVGIGGDSGSGKSTLCAGFSGLFGEDRITSICLDDYHSLDRRERALLGVTPLSPRANDFAGMEQQIWRLKRGGGVSKPVYRHPDGTFGDPEWVEPREVVIVHGLHPFLVPGIRHAFDLKVWLDPEPELRLEWKLQRDVSRRGYRVEQVRTELERRRPDSEEFIAPQRRHADMVVRFFRPEPEVRDMGHLNVRIVQRHSLPRLAFDQEVHDAKRVNLHSGITDDDGQDGDVIEIDGRVSAQDSRLVEENIWAHIDGRHHHLRRVDPDGIGVYDSVEGRAHSDPLALTQLILAHRILSAQKSLLVRVTADDHATAGQPHVHL